MARKKAAEAEKKTAELIPDDGPIELEWNLAELPTTQHRAGLAGLVMLVRWMIEGGSKRSGVLEVKRLDAQGYKLRFDRDGLRWLYSVAYAAAKEEQQRDQKLKKGKGEEKQEIPPLREEEIEVTDDKGKKKKKKVYIYEVVVPRGAFLLDLDPSRNGTNGVWIKLWRDFIWSIVRGVPASRGPFERQAETDEAEKNVDADGDFASLSNLARGAKEKTVNLAGTYYLGAQDTTADGVPFSDRQRFHWLLQFWPYGVSLYALSVMKPDEQTRNFDGSLVAVFPDVSVLDEFCDTQRKLLEGRSKDVRGYRPAEACVDLPVESALHAALKLRARIAGKEGRKDTAELVTGFELVHVGKDGNNVRVYRSLRMEPKQELVNRYAIIAEKFHEFFFRRQRLLNLLEGREWYAGFDRLAETLPHREQFIGSKWFRIDARTAFKDAKAREEAQMAEGKEASLEMLVHRVVRNYANARVKARTGFAFEDVKDKAGTENANKYNDELERVGRQTFLAARSRTGADFRDFFTGTLCSVHQQLGKDGYQLLARELKERPEDVRTLTMLALSSLSGVFEKKS